VNENERDANENESRRASSVDASASESFVTLSVPTAEREPSIADRATESNHRERFAQSPSLVVDRSASFVGRGGAHRARESG